MSDTDLLKFDELGTHANPKSVGVARVRAVLRMLRIRVRLRRLLASLPAEVEHYS